MLDAQINKKIKTCNSIHVESLTTKTQRKAKAIISSESVDKSGKVQMVGLRYFNHYKPVINILIKGLK